MVHCSPQHALISPLRIGGIGAGYRIQVEVLLYIRTTVHVERMVGEETIPIVQILILSNTAADHCPHLIMALLHAIEEMCYAPKGAVPISTHHDIQKDLCFDPGILRQTGVSAGDTGVGVDAGIGAGVDDGSVVGVGAAVCVAAGVGVGVDDGSVVGVGAAVCVHHLTRAEGEVMFRKTVCHHLTFVKVLHIDIPFVKRVHSIVVLTNLSLCIGSRLLFVGERLVAIVNDNCCSWTK